jgi:hypothetical protein
MMIRSMPILAAIVLACGKSRAEEPCPACVSSATSNEMATCICSGLDLLDEHGGKSLSAHRLLGLSRSIFETILRLGYAVHYDLTLPRRTIELIILRPTRWQGADYLFARGAKPEPPRPAD